MKIVNNIPRNSISSKHSLASSDINNLNVAKESFLLQNKFILIGELGDLLSKGQMLFIMTEELYDPGIDISQLPYIPFSNPVVKFEIYAERVERNRLIVNVIEVRDIAPINPLRSEENEANSKKPLRFGSRTEVTTAGNWE